MLCSSSNTILQSTSFKGLTCIAYYSQFVFNPNPKTGRAISFILDDARHKKRGCANHPAELGLTQLPEPVGQLWTELDDTKAHGNLRQIFIVHFLRLPK